MWHPCLLIHLFHQTRWKAEVVLVAVQGCALLTRRGWDTLCTAQIEHRALPLHHVPSLCTCFSSEGGRAFHYNLARHLCYCTGPCTPCKAHHTPVFLVRGAYTKEQCLNYSLVILTPEAQGHWSALGERICSSKLKEYLKEERKQCTEIKKKKKKNSSRTLKIKTVGVGLLNFWLPHSKQKPPTFRDHLHNVEVAHQECLDLKLVQPAAVRHTAPRGASADLMGHRCDMEAGGSGHTGYAQLERGAGCRVAWTQQIQHMPDVPAFLLSPYMYTPTAPCFGDISSFGVTAHPSITVWESWAHGRTLLCPEKERLGREQWLNQQNTRQPCFHFPCSQQLLDVAESSSRQTK